MPWTHSYSGNYNADLNFEYGVGTNAHNGCGATLMGEFWYFDGYRQVNSLITFDLETICIFTFRSARLFGARWCVKILWLSIFSEDHATHLFNRSRKYCFVLTSLALLNVICKFKIENIIRTWTWMFRFDGENFLAAGSSKYSHRRTDGMGNYKNKALTTGCEEDFSCYVKTELMDMETLQWSNGPDYPFAS